MLKRRAFRLNLLHCWRIQFCDALGRAMMAEVKLGRRNFLKGAGAAGAAGAALATGLAGCSPESTAQAAAPAAEPEVWHTLNATEAAFIKAAVDTLIPADELTPSGSDV